MKKKIRPTSETRGEADPDRDTMRDEYDFSRAMRGVTAARFREGTNVVILDPDVSALYPNSAAVNEALRGLAAGAKLRQNKSRRRRSQG